MTLVVIEYADPTALSGDINATCVRVIDQHVGRFADFVVVDDSSVGQVHRHHRGVGFAADEHDLIGGVERKTVWVVATGRGNPFRDGETVRIDDSEVVAALHRNDHLIEKAVVYDVSYLTPQRNRRADCAGHGVDNRLGGCALVGRPDGPPDRVVGQAVGIGVRRSAEHHLARVLVDGDELVVTGGRGV